MDDESKFGTGVKVGLGALGLGAVGAVVMDRHYGIWIAVAILVLALLLFGGYFLWNKMRARKRRERFSSAIEAQTAAAPKSISDPNKRAALDKLRQKFQTGLQEFRSRGKDIYKLPWYVIIGEPGSGKTEAIRNSGIDFPPGLQDELQGSGGTVNMDWWFTNRGIILDTAGSMIFGEAAGEAPEWREFLRLLKKSRPHCPVNGLFLVLSIESLIKDSADTISKKASRLAQQLDLIQRALDVRFPVYLLVTKCDLLAGFREFFDSIDDPLLQHQMFGWSNPEPLDSHFRPEMVEKHLTSVSERLRRRRMALLRDNSTAGRLGDTNQFFAASYQLGRPPTTSRRLDEVDAMFALPESIMRLAPRLRLYLETVFVAGEWSAKPVFLRGIYFTTSMREGKALDEAIAQATGLSLDQLPEERNWDKKRAFFLRDLFHEKIFREAGLVTRATNTLKLLRTRQLAIFGTAGAALLILLIFAWFGYRSLQNSVGKEAGYWRAATNGWDQGVWSSGSVVHPGANNPLHFAYAGTNQLSGLDEKLTVAQFHEHLRQLVSKQLSVGWIFKPIFWIGSRGASDRATAQRILFERGVLAPLVQQTRAKMTNADTALSNPTDVARHRAALQSLMALEADGISGRTKGGGMISGDAANNYLKSLLAYLTDDDTQKPDTNLLDTFTWTYSKKGSGDGKWPPKFLLGGNTLAENATIKIGMEKFSRASKSAQTNLDRELGSLKDLTDNLIAYQQAELVWLTNSGDACASLNQTLQPREQKVAASWAALSAETNVTTAPLTNLAMRYFDLGKASSNASAAALSAPVEGIVSSLPDASRTTGLFADVQTELRRFIQQAGEGISSSYNERSNWMASLDTYQLVRVNGTSAHAARWSLYANACALASSPINVDESVVGDGWTRYGNLQKKADQFRANLAAYNGPMADLTSNVCNRIAGDAEQRLKTRFVGDYAALVKRKLSDYSGMNAWTPDEASKAGAFLAGAESDLKSTGNLGDDEKAKLTGIGSQVGQCRKAVMANIGKYVHSRLSFPLLPPSGTGDHGMETLAMGDLRAQVNSFLNELQKTNWQATPADLRLLQASGGRLNALLTDSDPPAAAKCKIYFVPPGDDDSNGRTIISIYRNARLSLGQQKTDWSDDLATVKDEKLVAEGTVDSALKISFRLDADAPDSAAKTTEYSNWGILRLIYDSKNQDGTNWVVRVPLENQQTNKTGTVTFKGDVSFKVVFDRPLPKIEDWFR